MLECLDFLNNLRSEKYNLTNCWPICVMEREIQDFETDVSTIYQFYSRNELEIEKNSKFAKEDLFKKIEVTAYGSTLKTVKQY